MVVLEGEVGMKTGFSLWGCGGVWCGEGKECRTFVLERGDLSYAGLDGLGYVVQCPWTEEVYRKQDLH